jgi:hypothetical protein
VMRLVGALVLIATWSFLQPTLTAGICGRLAEDDPLPTDADFIFVGTVAETAAHEQNALIHVEEIWRGGTLPEWLPVIGTDDPNLFWEDQTQLITGERYLVVAYRQGTVVRPGGCGYTTPYSGAQAALRPSSASRPSPVPRPILWEPGGIPWLGVGIAVGVLLVGGLFIVGLRLRRRAAVSG